MPRFTRTFFIHFPIYPKVYSPETAVGPNTRTASCNTKLHLPSLAAPPSTSGPDPGEYSRLPLHTQCHRHKPTWANKCQEKNKLKKINPQMFMHFTYTVPHGPLLGQRETTSARFIGFMKCVSGTTVREMLHNNTEAFLKPCFQCLSTFNLLSIIKSIVMHSLQPRLPPQLSV